MTAPHAQTRRPQQPAQRPRAPALPRARSYARECRRPGARPDAGPSPLQEQGAGEGPAWHPKLGLSTSGDGHIYRRARDGKVSIYRRDAGLERTPVRPPGPAGDLRAGQPPRDAARGRTAASPSWPTTIEGKRFNQPNDLTIDSKGRIYFSDPRYGDRGDMEIVDEQGRKVEGVYRIDPDGTVTAVIGRRGRSAQRAGRHARRSVPLRRRQQ